jgi:hypothetical protein
MNPIYPLPPFFKIHFNIIPPSASSVQSSLSEFATETDKQGKGKAIPVTGRGGP